MSERNLSIKGMMDYIETEYFKVHYKHFTPGLLKAFCACKSTTEHKMFLQVWYNFTDNKLINFNTSLLAFQLLVSAWPINLSMMNYCHEFQLIICAQDERSLDNGNFENQTKMCLHIFGKQDFVPVSAACKLVGSNYHCFTLAIQSNHKCFTKICLQLWTDFLNLCIGNNWL